MKKYDPELILISQYILKLSGGRTIQLFTKNNPELINQIKESTAFLDELAGLMERVHCITSDIHTKTKCNGCDTPVKWNKSNRSYKTYCSLSCKGKDSNLKKKVKSTFIKKYGVKNASQVDGVNEKKIQTCLNNHGVEWAQQKESLRQKTRDTNNETFGVDYPLQNPKIVEQCKKTNTERYGVDNVSKHPDIQKKRIETNFKKYGQKHFNTATIKHAIEFLNNKDWLYNEHYIKQKSLLQISNELNVCDKTVGRYLHQHGLETQHFSMSQQEKDLVEFITSIYKDDIQTNTRDLISPLEIDIYLPKLKLAIEYCGLYWHCEQQGKDRNYHKNKLQMCNKLGIRLLTIFEDEWIHKQDITKSKLKSILHVNQNTSIFARNTTCADISTSDKNIFLDQYHIQGSGRGSISYGLEYHNSLVAGITFIKQQNNEYILNRYATSCSIPGGFSKLLKHFQRNNQWNKIITFADLRWSNGNLYQQCDFSLDKTLPPDYYYINTNNQTRIHKFNYRRRNLPVLLEHFDPKLSEKQNCDNNGILRIWNCGLNRYILTN